MSDNISPDRPRPKQIDPKSQEYLSRSREKIHPTVDQFESQFGDIWNFDILKNLEKTGNIDAGNLQKKVFGAKTLWMAHSWGIMFRGDNEGNKRAREGNLRRQFEKSREELKIIYDNLRTKQFVVDFFQDSLNDERVFSSQEGLKPTDIKDLFDAEKIPDDVYARMLKVHIERFQKKQKDFEEQLSSLIKTFKGNVARAKTDGINIPLRPREIDMLVKRIEFEMGDGLLVSMMDIYGSYSGTYNKIVIAEQTPDEDIDMVFAHEMIHAMAGKTVLQEDSSKAEFTEQRGGLHFTTDTTKAGEEIFVDRFRWLNEAVTEMLAQNITYGENAFQKGHSYHKEGLIAMYLSTAFKVRQHLFIDAYFEDYKTSGGIPAWKKLYQAINKAFYPRFLVDLDKVIQEKGIDEGLSFVKSQFSEDELKIIDLFG